MDRDAPVSIEVVGEGETSPEPITDMVSRGGYLAIFKPHGIFKMETPESLDPHRTQESAPFVLSQVRRQGSANPIVARTFLQAKALFETTIVTEDVNKSAALDALYDAMFMLLDCREIFVELNGDFLDKAKLILEDITQLKSQRILTNVPQIEKLEERAKSFLLNNKRVLDRYTDMFNALLGSRIPPGYFHRALDWCVKSFGAEDNMVQFLTSDQPWIRRLIAMRIAIEHQDSEMKLTVRNIGISADRKIIPPTWHLLHDSFPDEQSTGLINDMNLYLENTLTFGEELFLLCIQKRIREPFGFYCQEIHEKNRDGDKPVRFVGGSTIDEQYLSRGDEN